METASREHTPDSSNPSSLPEQQHRGATTSSSSLLTSSAPSLPTAEHSLSTQEKVATSPLTPGVAIGSEYHNQDTAGGQVGVKPLRASTSASALSHTDAYTEAISCEQQVQEGVFSLPGDAYVPALGSSYSSSSASRSEDRLWLPSPWMALQYDPSSDETSSSTPNIRSPSSSPRLTPGEAAADRPLVGRLKMSFVNSNTPLVGPSLLQPRSPDGSTSSSHRPIAVAPPPLAPASSSMSMQGWGQPSSSATGPAGITPFSPAAAAPAPVQVMANRVQNDAGWKPLHSAPSRIRRMAEERARRLEEEQLRRAEAQQSAVAASSSPDSSSHDECPRQHRHHGEDGDKRRRIDEASTTASSSYSALSASSSSSGSSPTLPPAISTPSSSSSLLPTRLRDFEVLGILGTGTFGRVLLVRTRRQPTSTRNRSSNSSTTSPRQQPPRLYALKALDKAHLTRMRQIEHVTSERDILLRVNHPFIVSCHATYQDTRCIYLALDFVSGGELFTYLRRAQRFPLEVAKFYLASIVLVLKYLHEEHNVVYRDLKPENLLLDAQGYVKVTDFGFAKKLGGRRSPSAEASTNGSAALLSMAPSLTSSSDGNERTYTLCGTPDFLSPETVRGTGHGKASDWWQLGVLTYELLAGYPPFCASSPYATYEKILAASPETIQFPTEGAFAVEGTGEVARDFVRSLLTPDLSKRLGNLAGGARDVMEHPFFAGTDWEAMLQRKVMAPIVPPRPMEVGTGDSGQHTSGMVGAAPASSDSALLVNFARYPNPKSEEMPALLGHGDEEEEGLMGSACQQSGGVGSGGRLGSRSVGAVRSGSSHGHSNTTVTSGRAGRTPRDPFEGF